MKYQNILTFFTLLFVSVGMYSQHTKIINTYRPGTSQGAFSVGKKVIQVETGISVGKLKHDVFNNATTSTELEYLLRAGFLKEQLEFSIQGSYMINKVSEDIGNTRSFTDKGFPANVIGAKYLVYDPYKYAREKNENLHSWKENNGFQWKKLIPAVSAYAGANFSSSASDFYFKNNPDNRTTKAQPKISPKIVISAQNNWTYNWVFVVNLIADRLGSKFTDFRFILTSTYTINDKWSVFGEYEAANSKIYKDHLFRGGLSYLTNKNLAFDAHILKNLKHTPSIIALNFGVAYRLDYHKAEDYERVPTGEQKELEETIEQIKKDIEEGFLEESVLTGKLEGKIDLEEYAEKEEEEFDEDFEGNEEVEAPKKKKWFQFWKKKKHSRKKRSKNDTIEAPKLGAGGRISDFVDEEFIKSKQKEITPKERTEEELAEIEAKSKPKKRKRNRKSDDLLIDPETGEPYPEPDYTGMSKKEIKKAKKQEKELREFAQELHDLENEIVEEQSERELRKAQKKREKVERKKQRQLDNQTTEDENTSFEEETIKPKKEKKKRGRKKKGKKKKKSKKKNSAKKSNEKFGNFDKKSEIIEEKLSIESKNTNTVEVEAKEQKKNLKREEKELAKELKEKLKKEKRAKKEDAKKAKIEAKELKKN